MGVHFRCYKREAGMTSDYYKIRNFLVKLRNTSFTYARWDWMIIHDYLDISVINKIGIWEDVNGIIGIAVFDLQLGVA